MHRQENGPEPKLRAAGVNGVLLCNSVLVGEEVAFLKGQILFLRLVLVILAVPVVLIAV